MKILAIKFKYLGDVAITIPALRTLRQTYPSAQLHVLVSQEAIPILEHIPWIDKVWGYPRKKGQGTKKEAFSLIRNLRKEKFNLSVDFVGNDRGAWISLAVGAKIRLGQISPKGFFGRKFCYSHRIKEAPHDLHEIDRTLHILSRLGITNFSTHPELYAAPALDPFAQSILPQKAILCHLSTSSPGKEWPIQKWIEFYNASPEFQDQFIFSSGPSARERQLLSEILKFIPNARTIDDILSLQQFMAIVKNAHAIICGDTFISHAAAGLNIPVVTLFGPTLARLWGPKGNSISVEADWCHCRTDFYQCSHHTHCLSTLSVPKVKSALLQLLERTSNLEKTSA
ncbi:MAG: hypothetical protein C5B43_04525 [Verrucomicrobia bacterium]|nr:MAG: hypothetical protein C5B43_04525 [Verrucomicrobiota bacterium]